MAKQIPFLPAEPHLRRALDEFRGRTVMVIGTVGTGKSSFARLLAEQLVKDGCRAALLSADVGQPSFGVPTCLALATSPPWSAPVAQWFIGDNSPGGNLLPVVVGTARLAEHARSEGAECVVIDTGGLVDTGVGRALKYHQVLAANVERVVAIERAEELAPLIDLLDQPAGRVIVCRPSPLAKNRSNTDRRARRQRAYQAHFEAAESCDFALDQVVGRDWAPLAAQTSGEVENNTVAGLLDQNNFCLALGIVEAVTDDSVRIRTPWQQSATVARVQLGRVRIDPQNFLDMPPHEERQLDSHGSHA